MRQALQVTDFKRLFKLARLLLKDQKPAPDMFPSEHLLRLREAAEAKFADKLAGISRT